MVESNLFMVSLLVVTTLFVVMAGIFTLELKKRRKSRTEMAILLIYCFAAIAYFTLTTFMEFIGLDKLQYVLTFLPPFLLLTVWVFHRFWARFDRRMTALTVIFALSGGAINMYARQTAQTAEPFLTVFISSAAILGCLTFVKFLIKD